MQKRRDERIALEMYWDWPTAAEAVIVRRFL
jgi:hypothetical protein